MVTMDHLAPGMHSLRSQEPQNHKTMMEWEQRHHGNLQDNEVNAAAFSGNNTGVDRIPVAVLFAFLVSDLKSEWGKLY